MKKLRSEIRRNKLHDYSARIIALDSAIQNMEDTYDFKDFDQHVGCCNIRGLAAHLTNNINAEEMYFNAVIDNIASDDQVDPFMEPISLYYLGLLYKNLANFTEAKLKFETALAKWPKENVEIRTRVELAEAVALQSHYAVAVTRTYLRPLRNRTRVKRERKLRSKIYTY